MILSLPFLLALCLIPAVYEVQAAEPAEIKIPVTIVLEGILPEQAENFLIKMQAADENSAMPEGSVDGIYTLVIKGENSAFLPKFSFEKPGIYTYSIWQEPGQNSKCTYDETIYKMTIYVTNNEQYDGFDTTVTLYKNSETEKQDEIVFINRYKQTVSTGDMGHVDFYLMLIVLSITFIYSYILKMSYKHKNI